MGALSVRVSSRQITNAVEISIVSWVCFLCLFEGGTDEGLKIADYYTESVTEKTLALLYLLSQCEVYENVYVLKQRPYSNPRALLRLKCFVF